MKINLDEKQIKNILILGIIIAAVGAPVCYFALDKFYLADGAVDYSGDSDAEIGDAWSKQFDLLEGQKVLIKFSGAYEGITTHLKIFSKSEYDSLVAASANPNTSVGLWFVETVSDLSATPNYNDVDDRQDVTNDPEGDFHLIEFAGHRGGSNNAFVQSIPGTYVVIVYGANTGSGESIKFEITIKLDGPGRLLMNWLIVGGLVLAGICALALTFKWIRRITR